jgi:hypothetical protein
VFSSYSACSRRESTYLNDYFPTVSYSGLAADDKNYPLKVFYYYLSPDNCADLKSAELELLTTLAFAKSGLMKTMEREEWATVSESIYARVEAAVCNSESKTFQYNYDSNNASFLVLLRETEEFEAEFLVANQRCDNQYFVPYKNINSEYVWYHR